MDQRNQARQMMLLGFVLAIATLVTYWPALQHEFVNYDDPDYVTENDWVKGGLTWAGVKWAFTTGHASNWHPLTWLSHMLDVQLFGMGPKGHHGTNVVLHTVNSVLLLVLLWQMTGAVWRSAVVAGLFALHPLHVESVAWVAERKDVLSTFFGLLCLMAYSAYAKSRVQSRGSRVAYVMAAMFLALGLMSKPMLVTWPFVMLLLDVWPLRRMELSTFNIQHSTLKRLVVEKLPFFALIAVSCSVTLLVQRTAMADAGLPVTDRLGNATLAYVDYLRQTLWPGDLAIFYPYPSPPPTLKVLGAAAVLMAATVGILRQRRRLPFLMVGWLWYLGTLVPVIGLVQVGSQARADRYTYIPLIGLFLMMAWGAAWLLSIRPRLKPWLTTAAGLAVIALILTTRTQLATWRNSETLFAHAVRVTQGNYIAWAGLGIVEYRRENYDRAIEHLAMAKEVAPAGKARDQIKFYLGATLQKQGRGREALPLLEEAEQVGRLEPERDYRLGLSLLEAGRVDEAEAALQRASLAKPHEVDFQLGMAALLTQRGRIEDAGQLLAGVVANNPEKWLANSAFGEFLYQQGRPQDAERYYAKAVDLAPDEPRLRQGYARCLATLGKLAAAQTELEQASKLRPDDPQICFELAEVLSADSQPQRALNWYERAIHLSPGHIPALNNLAWLLATHSADSVRDGRRAVELARQACELTDWKQAVLMGTLAAAYAEAGRFPEAVVMAERARDRAREEKQNEVATRNEQLIKLYRSGKPFREK